MVFLEHFVGDIHQPLHVISRITNGCAEDKGGNDFCFRESKTSYCRKNLHALWDNALG